MENRFIQLQQFVDLDVAHYCARTSFTRHYSDVYSCRVARISNVFNNPRVSNSALRFAQKLQVKVSWKTRISRRKFRKIKLDAITILLYSAECVRRATVTLEKLIMYNIFRHRDIAAIAFDFNNVQCQTYYYFCLFKNEARRYTFEFYTYNGAVYTILCVSWVYL